MLQSPLHINTLTFEEVQVGQSASFAFKVEEEHVENFARLSGDFSPVHMDEQLARRTRYRERVAQGMLVCAPVSSLIGMCLPGKHAILLRQQVDFLHPVKIGDELTVYGEVKSKSEATQAIVLRFKIANLRSGQTVVRGQANVQVAQPPKEGIAMADISEIDLKLDFSDNVVLVTGASRGIGEATAKLFAYHGARVVINYFRGRDEAERTVQDISSSGAKAIAIRADVGNREEVDVMLQEALRQFGKVDVLINNAVGDYTPLDFTHTTWEDMQSDLDVTVKGAFNCIQAVLPIMLHGGYGRIVNVCTTATDTPPARYCKYVTAKSALLGLTRALATELGPKNILINAVSPGLTDTDLISHIPGHVRTAVGHQVPVGRIAEPIDIAKAILLLTSRYASYISGHQLVVDGGSVKL